MDLMILRIRMTTSFWRDSAGRLIARASLFYPPRSPRFIAIFTFNNSSYKNICKLLVNLLYRAPVSILFFVQTSALTGLTGRRHGHRT